MDKIIFFLWATRISSLSDEKWDLRTNSIAKGSKIIEDEINSNGGIFSKPVKLIYKFFESIDFKIFITI